MLALMRYAVACEYCQRPAPTKYVAFGCNIGLIVTRLSKSVSGQLCKDCIRRFFWEYTLTTLFLWWWGVISFFRTLYLLPANIIDFASAWRLPPPTEGDAGPADADAPRARVIRGNDIEETIELSAAEAASGTQRRVRMGSGTVLEVTIPAGVQDRSVLRMQGNGVPASPAGGGTNGNLYLVLRVLPDATSTSSVPEESVKKAYLVLEVPPGSDLGAVRDSYQRLMRKYDPDLNDGSPEKRRAAIELTRSLTDAFKLLETRLQR